METGVQFQPLEYRRLMSEDGRIVKISQGSYFAILVYSITNDYRTFIDKDQWEFLPHDFNGHTLVIEKMCTNNWNYNLRMSVKNFIESNFPKVREVIWVRSKLKGTEYKDHIMIKRTSHV